MAEAKRIQEQKYKKALAKAETEAGVGSALAGLYVLELWDLYDKEGRELEADSMWRRLMEILASYRNGEPV